jgi:hypothetical protein
MNCDWFNWAGMWPLGAVDLYTHEGLRRWELLRKNSPVLVEYTGLVACCLAINGWSDSGRKTRGQSHD